MLNSERLLILSPKALSEVLTTKCYDFEKPKQVVRGLGRVLGIGVLLAEGEEHKFQRKNLMPAFAFRHVKDLYPVFWGKSKEVARAMSKEVEANVGRSQESDSKIDSISADQGVLIAANWASRATLDIIGVAGMGQDFGAIANPHTTLSETYNTIVDPTKAVPILQLLNLLFPPWFIRIFPIKRNAEVDKAVDYVRSTCARLISAKKEKFARNELTDVDILSVALESGAFTDENLIDQVMTFLGAGHETTATALTWAVYMMCLHPNVQEKLRSEIRDRLPSLESEQSVTSVDIDHMPYLNAVCSEVLRYYSPVPFTFREAVVDTSILGHFVPKGTKIAIVPPAVNKDTSLWGEDALSFNPDRWLPSVSESPHVANGGAPSNYAFMTFLHGPRSCIGQAFSRAEFACLLAAWIGRLQFELNNPEEMDEAKMKIGGRAVSRPLNGLWVKARVVPGW